MKRLYVLLLAALLPLSVFCQSKDFKLGKWTEIRAAVLRELDRCYVDSLPVDRMERAAIDAMLASLDPYTVYIPAEEDEDLQMMISKTYGGIGAIIYKPDKNGPVIINEPYEGSPAALGGLECGDEILEIDGETTSGLETKQASDRMKGVPDTRVVFKVRKVRTGEIRDIEIIRRQIHLPDIAWAGFVAPGVGYVSQSGFTVGVADSVRAEFVRLKEQGMQKFVLDLRGNGGGLMDEAVKIVSIFVPKGSLVVSSRGKEASHYAEYRTESEPEDVEIPVVVLVDGGSASASEIVSGALQDLDRATIMGKRTFGKGLVQNIRPLPYGGKIKITTAKYYTPSGRCVQAIDYSNRGEDGSVGYIPDSLTHEFRTAGGRTVRDGGGITPDVDIPVKKYSDITYDLVVKGVVEQYVLDFVCGHASIAPADDYRFEGYEEFKAFALGKMPDKASEIEVLDPSEIVPFIEEEIVVRYYYQRAGEKVHIRYDEQLKEALSSPLITDTVR